MTIICNLMGGPGSGKSTTATGVFSALKLRGFNVEYVNEVAKDLVWEKRPVALSCQPYVLGKQLRNIERLVGQVEAVITDGPFLLGMHYAMNEPESFRQFILDKFRQFDNRTFYLDRVKDYNPKGRNQTLDQAKEIDQILLNILIDNCIPFSRLTGNAEAITKITDTIESAILLKR